MVVEQVGLDRGNTQVCPATVHRQALKVRQEGKQPCLPLSECFKGFDENCNLPGTVVHTLVPKEAGQPGLQGEPCLKTKLESTPTHVCYFSQIACADK